MSATARRSGQPAPPGKTEPEAVSESPVPKSSSISEPATGEAETTTAESTSATTTKTTAATTTEPAATATMEPTTAATATASAALRECDRRCQPEK